MRHTTEGFLLVILLVLSPFLYGQEESSAPIQIEGVFPHMTILADGVGSNSETGIGALIPWGNRLWAIAYVAHIFQWGSIVYGFEVLLIVSSITL